MLRPWRPSKTTSANPTRGTHPRQRFRLIKRGRARRHASGRPYSLSSLCVTASCTEAPFEPLQAVLLPFLNAGVPCQEAGPCVSTGLSSSLATRRARDMPCLMAWACPAIPPPAHLNRNAVIVGQAGGYERLMNYLLERSESEQFVHGHAIDDYCTGAGYNLTRATASLRLPMA